MQSHVRPTMSLVAAAVSLSELRSNSPVTSPSNQLYEETPISSYRTGADPCPLPLRQAAHSEQSSSIRGADSNREMR